MNVVEKQSNGALILSVTGRLDSNTSESFSKLLTEKLDAGNTKIIVDMSKLDYISSAGLRVLLMAAKRLMPTSGKFILCDMNTHIKEVFEISGFLNIMTITDNVKAAQKLLT